MKNIIINKPEKLGSFKKGMEWSFTLLGWIFWFFFCRPFLIALLWFFGLKLFYIHMIYLEGLQGVFALFRNYLFVLLFIILSLRGWNLYNQMRFKGKNRRRSSPEVKEGELDQYFRMNEGSTKKIQTWKDIKIDFLQEGGIKISNENNVEEAPLEGTLKRP
ncbi:poly-beta-1,6-N-acetyl-D-glucosamine biosynthesis protein PgaD [candidate division KSB3 bacterium]|uniref:Poly-beta-1,6-N-acetyl-D-glucosamine biosynthesis protein PgaD n=1 Tax=candidate division KSB3 bacterium TaxID=2044937 RepID=A0A9D5JXB0_9BACT|nr:poly-beta-1,6-N-acetyl-D-glucosamine biosynthesis protein PgaD [candidate division KSB3 bacterium]